MDPTPPDHPGEDADVPAVVLDGGAEDGRIFGEVALGQGRHDATWAGLGDADEDVVAEREGAADPGVFHESLGAVGGLNDEVGPEASRLEAALRGEFAEAIERR